MYYKVSLKIRDRSFKMTKGDFQYCLFSFAEKVKPKVIYFIPGVLWLAITVVLLVIPGSDIPKATFFDLIYLDKWVHIGMFGILALLWCYPFRQTKTASVKTFTIIAICVISYGVLME